MVTTRKGTKRKAEPVDEQPEYAQATDLPVRAKSDSPEVTRAPKPSVQGTLQVFDSDDEDDDAIIPTKLSAVEKPAVIADSEENSESDDDDDAPEAVATTHVVSKAEKSAKSAQQAAQEQAAEQKRKRQQQDALYKKQASQRKAARPIPQADDKEEAPESSLSRRNIKGPALNLLPEELLESSSEYGSDDEEMDGLADNRPKRRKLSAVEQKLARQSRGPRDERVGSTVYRVEKKRDPILAPKAKRYTQNRKADLLQRGRAAVGSKKGFFKK